MSGNAAPGRAGNAAVGKESQTPAPAARRGAAILVAARQPTWDAVPLPGGGWRIVVPGRPVSSNQSGGGHEHWAERKRRLDGYVSALTYLRLQHGLHAVPVLARAVLRMTCYFPARKRRDPHNYGPGAGGKALVDALTLGTARSPRSGWVTDDAPEFLRVDGEPSIEVGALRTEIVLEPWEGER